MRRASFANTPNNWECCFNLKPWPTSESILTQESVTCGHLTCVFVVES